ncbi:aldose epimerase family protein [Cribrihabitans neustonicus]|uniref:aldose epimerase family protein n=1 Tax=Cribrihabitans neustonicus TaxID=1429085 RepID=UPI003B5B9512
MEGAAEFGRLPSGEAVHRYSIAGGGLMASILSYGATVQDLRLEGHPHPLVLGADHLAPYLGPLAYCGGLVGRFSNRIANGQFEIDGRAFQADRNENGTHCLHGGRRGASSRIWALEDLGADRVVLSLRMADGDMGFPGNLDVRAAFTLTASSGLEIEITARTDVPTPVSFAHHGYFNLDGSPGISGHLLRIDAPAVLPVDQDNIPTGEIRKAAGTEFDFRKPREIGGRRLDHNFCIARAPGVLREAAVLNAPQSGLAMRVETTAPGIQAYTCDHLPPAGVLGLEGRRCGPRAGLALETQAWPDAPNHRNFPRAVLRPGETYRHLVRYGFRKPGNSSR